MTTPFYFLKNNWQRLSTVIIYTYSHMRIWIFKVFEIGFEKRLLWMN